jgi:hypothetical protein
VIVLMFPVGATRVAAGGSDWNVAVTLWAAVMFTTHVPVPLHDAPLQPEKVEPEDAVAVKVTLAPEV